MDPYYHGIGSIWDSAPGYRMINSRTDVRVPFVLEAAEL